jgi:hypothetical protein
MRIPMKVIEGFAAVDPMNPQSVNRYAYVLSSPFVFIDPLGLDGVSCATSLGPGLCVDTGMGLTCRVIESRRQTREQAYIFGQWASA